MAALGDLLCVKAVPLQVKARAGDAEMAVALFPCVARCSCRFHVGSMRFALSARWKMGSGSQRLSSISVVSGWQGRTQRLLEGIKRNLNSLILQHFLILKMCKHEEEVALTVPEGGQFVTFCGMDIGFHRLRKIKLLVCSVCANVVLLNLGLH